MQSITGTLTLNARLPGQWYQLETGLHYNWHRHYDPTLGRYIQPDPLGFVDGPSVYGYGRSKPLIFIDRSGRTTYVLVNTGGDTGHTGIAVIGADGTTSVFDPGGSFNDSRGSGTGAFSQDPFTLSDYQKYFTDDPSSKLSIFTFPTTPEQEKEIIRRMENHMSCSKGFCTECSSDVLSNTAPQFKDLPQIYFPSAMKKEMQNRSVAPQ